jgi:hypothetical protein
MQKVHGNSEVKAMRRTLQPLLAATAGLALLLTACSGESPTSPKPPDNGGGTGACTVTITLDATAVTPLAGTAVILRATVRKGGATVPDGTSVTFTTDFGYFLETGLPSVSKVTQNGFADVTLGATSAGLSKVKATFECGTAEKSIEYQPVPTNGPFISSITPTSGSCAGGDVVTINGGKFGTSAANARVSFGGRPATIQTFSDSRIVVLTPSRTLANPQVPEAVDVVVTFYTSLDVPSGNVTAKNGFTYYCVDPNKRLTLSAVNPSSGSPDGGQAVTITGNNFLPSAASGAATTRVTFGGTSASVVSVTNTSISVLTPRRILANPAVPETVDVAVLVDLGLVSQQSALLANAYTYRAGGSAGNCAGTSGLFISTVLPEDPASTGTPDGGEVVVISGGGFTAGGTATTPERAAVYFGGSQGVTLSVSESQIRVTTPRRVLASPDRPETVDVRVVVDAGGPKEACVQAASAYTYYPGSFLEPVITSISPVSGPNDVSTRVTMFGRNFKLPAQVFLRVSGATIEAAVVEIRANEIIFLTPAATGPNSALAGQVTEVIVRDTYTGKEYVSPVPFRYYSCPTVNSVIPAAAPWNQATTVTIAGQNFEEPVEVTFNAGSYTLRPNVTSVSSSLITLVMPVVDPSLVGLASCNDVTGQLSIRFPSLASGSGNACSEIQTPFTYSVKPMTIVSATPTQLNQGGGPYGSPITGAQATITVSGSNFVDPMTVEVFNGGTTIPVNNAVVANATQLTFTAPAVRDADLNTQPCVPPNGTSPTGTKYVPTSFGIRLRNARTGCTVELPNVLIYNPADPSCRVALSVSTNSLPAATLCQAYGPVTVTATGGSGTYNWSASGLPAGVTITPAGVISGVPQMSSAGAGGTTIRTVTLSVTDTAPSSASNTIGLQFIDPNGPFSVTAPANATFTNLGGTTGSFTALPTTPLNFQPVNWTVIGGVAGITASGTGQTFAITVGAAVPAGTYNLQVTAVDTPSCGGPTHTATVSYTITKNP